MSANGQFEDPTDEDQASNAEIRDNGSGEADGNENVQSTAKTEKHQSSHADGSPALSGESAKHSKQQTQKSGLAALLQFLAEVLIELKKITWPDRQQVIKETLSVIVLVAIITGCVLAFDYGIAKAIFEPLDKLARHLGGGIGVSHTH